MIFRGYPVRIGQISFSANDEKNWYGAHFYGFGTESSLKHVELQMPFGFAARPVDATDGIGCNGFYSLEGEFAWLGHDARLTDKCPKLEHGSSAQWNSDGAYALLDTKKKTWTLSVPRASGTHTIVVGEDAVGAEIISVKHAGGASVTITATGITITGGAATDFVALAAKVDKALADLAVHVHGTGVGPTTPPSAPYTAPASVACTMTRTA